MRRLLIRAVIKTVRKLVFSKTSLFYLVLFVVLASQIHIRNQQEEILKRQELIVQGTRDGFVYMGNRITLTQKSLTALHEYVDGFSDFTLARLPNGLPEKKTKP